jgi:hypothetical protein
VRLFAGSKQLERLFSQTRERVLFAFGKQLEQTL